MASVNSINTERILWCCTDRGISIEELASAIEIRPDKLHKVLNGEESISISQLKKLAKFFGRGLLFFVESGPVQEERIRTAAFRTITNENPELDARTRSLIERVERQRLVFLSLTEDISDDEIQTFKPPRVDRANLSDSAVKVRNWLAINGNTTFDGYRTALEKKGVLVFRSNGYAGSWQIPSESSVWGFSIFHPQFPIIFVRKAVTESRQLFTLIHELGHLLLHSRGFVDELADFESNVGSERDANAFAGLLLVPNHFLRQISDAEKPDNPKDFDGWLKPFARRWGVSPEVVLRRLLDSKRLSRNDYLAYREWKSNIVQIEATSGSRAFRFREPKHIFGDRFVKAVLEALHSKQITLSRASTFLDNIKVADIHKLERVYNAF